MKTITFLFIFLISFFSYADYSNCTAIYRKNTLRGELKQFNIIKVAKISENHYNLKLKGAGSIRQKLDNFPTKLDVLIDVKCANINKEHELKKLLKL
jgi:hypothetical protein